MSYTAKERLMICRRCPYYLDLTAQCKICLCFMHIKTKLKSSSCPKGKW